MVNGLLRKNQHSVPLWLVFGVYMRISASSIFSRTVLPLMLVGVLASGCTSKDAKLESDPLATGSSGLAQNSTPTAAVSYLKTQELSKLWLAHPGDKQIGLDYANNLEKLGQFDTQIDVLKAVSVSNPADGALQSQIGKQFLGLQRPGEAVTVLSRAVAANGNDWKALSALGSAYDQQGQYDMARQQYSKALAVQPGSLSIENNMAMSFALQGKLPEAEKILREAMTQPGAAAQPRIRQNLALVVGLAGRFDESRQIASADLPPEQVEANLAYLQQMMAQPNTWAQLSSQNAGN
jgi:Flp pilus assembly protein TadD